MHAKSDSEVTSLATSSPNRSPPRRPAYYVQSPSRDSADGDQKTTSHHSFHSTPVLSPAGTPPHSNSSIGRHSRESSTSRFSGSLKSGSRKVNPADPAAGRKSRRGGDGGRGGKGWKDQCDVIEEEGLLEEEEGEKGLSRRCYVLAFLLGFILLFTFFSLILWGASRPQKPRISMNSITFHNFNIQAGTDASGVPTDMASMNSTVKFTFQNRATFFGLHVTSTPLDLSYSQLTLASGSIKKFYQSRRTHRNMSVIISGNMIPLYGGGSSLTTSNGNPSTNVPVPLDLSFMVRSRGYVLGQLVKPKFYTRVDCSLTLDQTKMNKPVSLKKSCQYN